jgi:hypothetical protein
MNPLSPEIWLGGHYTLGTSPSTWPKVVEEANRPEQVKPGPNELEIYLTLAVSTSGETICRRVASILADVMQSGRRFGTTQRVEATDQLLPDVECLVCPEVASGQTIRLEGYIRSIQRGREDLTLTEADLAALLPEEVDE